MRCNAAQSAPENHWAAVALLKKTYSQEGRLVQRKLLIFEQTSACRQPGSTVLAYSIVSEYPCAGKNHSGGIIRL